MISFFSQVECFLEKNWWFCRIAVSTITSIIVGAIMLQVLLKAMT